MSASVSSYSPPGLSSAALAAPAEKQGSALEDFFNILRKNFDHNVCDEVFIPLWTVIFEGCLLQRAYIGEHGYCYLEFDAPYVAKLKTGDGEVNYIEQKLVMQFMPEENGFDFPLVRKTEKFDPSNKNLGGIWGSESHIGRLFSGIPYSIKWNAAEKEFTYDNSHNVPWLLSSLATPRIYSPEKIKKHWEERTRERVAVDSGLPKGTLGTSYA